MTESSLGKAPLWHARPWARCLKTAFLSVLGALSLGLYSAPSQAITRCEALRRAQAWVDAGVMYSWDAWYTDPTTGTCCYRSDCSGLVSAAWGLGPPGNTTYSFAGGPWDDGVSYVISASELQPGDALNYPGDPGAGTGHIMLYVSGDFWSGSVEVYEEYSHGHPAEHRWRTINPNLYLPIRYNNIEPCCTPTTEVCNGQDDDCDGQTDEDGVCCSPSSEVCNGKDDDCDGQTDEDKVCQIASEPLQQGPNYDSPSNTDLNGDGKADVCARAASGIVCALGTETGLGPVFSGPTLTDDSGWSDPSNYNTIRFADVTGDGQADLCARANDLVRCYPFAGTDFGPSFQGPALSDADHWDQDPYNATLRFGDLNGDGKDDLCGRGPDGVQCYLSTGSGFGPAIAGPELRDSDGWGDVSNWGTLRMGDVNGDGHADLCARADASIWCWPFETEGFGERFAGPELTDANGWDQPIYWATLRLADINGDGMDDICGRGADRMFCWLSLGDGFGPAIDGPEWSNANGWTDYDNWSTIRFADINGDGKDDACGRSDEGFSCWLSTGEGFGTEVPVGDMSNAYGWADPKYYQTIRMADINGDGKADVCARASAGLACWLSTGEGFTSVSGTDWSDANGWGTERYFATIRAGSHQSCHRAEEKCNGRDDNCNGQVDEGCAGVDAGPQSDGSPGVLEAGSSDGGSRPDGSAPSSPAMSSEEPSSCACRLGPANSPTAGSWTLVGMLGAWLLSQSRRRVAKHATRPRP